jgi:hypothetical protein
LEKTARKDLRFKDTGKIKGTILEELCDVLYYVVLQTFMKTLNPICPVKNPKRSQRH